MEEVIAERLSGRIWEELTPKQARSAKYVSREFVGAVRGWRGASVGDFSHLSDQYSAVLTKSETLEVFSVSIRRHDAILSMDLRSGYTQFRLLPAMRYYFVVSVKLMDGTVRYFRYLVLPCGWSRSGYCFSRLVSRFLTTIKSRCGYRVLSYVDDYLICPSTGRASTKMDCLRASDRLDKLLLRYGLTRHLKKGVWSGGSQVLQHLGFVIDSVRGSFGVPASKLDKGEQYGSGVIEAGQMHCPQGTRSRARVVRWQSSKPQAGRPRNGVQAEDPLRRHPPRGPSIGPSLHHYRSRPFFSRSRFLAFVSQLRSEALYWCRYARLSHLAVSDLKFWRDLPKHLHHRPIWPSHPSPTTTIHTDSSLGAFGATLGRGPLEAGSEGFYEMSGLWDK
jgi:Reverse transcriptase (RNA-dependent DNA polymerase)